MRADVRECILAVHARVRACSFAYIHPSICSGLSVLFHWVNTAPIILLTTCFIDNQDAGTFITCDLNLDMSKLQTRESYCAYRINFYHTLGKFSRRQIIFSRT